MKVSIITACYNSAATIEDTLQSVANQDYPNIEHIIVDGASSDDTLEIAERFHHVSKIISEKDKGIYYAMNTGIHIATGDIIAILNSDDFYSHNAVISNVVQKMLAENADCLYADLDYVNPQNTKEVLRKWRSGKFASKKFHYGWMPPHPTFFVKREIYEKYGDFDTSFVTAADYELMLRFLLKYNIPVSYLDETIVHMRAGGHSASSLMHRIKANIEDSKAWKKNKLNPYFFTTILKPTRKIYQFFPKKRKQ